MAVDWYEDPEDINAELDTYSKSFVLWNTVGFDASEEKIREWCENYSISYDDAMAYKDYWREKHEITIEKRKRKMESRKVTK